MNEILEVCFILVGVYGILTSKRVARDGIQHSRKWFGDDYGKGKNYEAQGRVFIIIVSSLFIVMGVLLMLNVLHWKGEVY